MFHSNFGFGKYLGKLGAYNSYETVLALLFLGLAQVFLLTPKLSGQVQASTPVIISQVIPSSGPTTGGNVIRVLGSGFTASDSVWIWANQAATVQYVSANEVNVVVPAKSSPGAVDVVLTNSFGATGRLNSGYAFTKPSTPVLSLSTVNLSFGNVTVGGTATQTLTINSSGTGPVSISNVAISGSGFSIVGGSLGGVPQSSVVYPAILNAGVQATIIVQYKPTVAGAGTGLLTISSNASNGSPLSVALKGTALAATYSRVAISPTTLSMGNVVVGNSVTQAITVTSTGTAPATLNSASVSGAGYSISGIAFPVTLAVGQATSLSVQFKPASAGAVAGKISISSNDSNGPAVVSLSATGLTRTYPHVTISPASVSMGSVEVGKSAAQSITLTSSGTAAVVINSAAISVAGYSVSGMALPATLAVGQTAAVTVQFKPTCAGAVAGQLVVSSNDTNGPAVVALSGTGITPASPKLAITPASLNLGAVAIGKSVVQNLTLTSSGTAPVVISSASISGAGFSVSGLVFPATLGVGQTATLAVQFNPASVGAASGQLVISSNDPVGPAMVSVTASGIAAAPAGTPLNACGTLAQSGTYYLNQSVSSSGTCFFIDADNISLNLHGNSITYATGGGAKPTPAVVLADPWYTFLAKSGSTYSHNNFEIFNGSITESKSGAAKSAAIWVGQSSGIAFPKVHDLVLTTYTQDAIPIYGDISQSGWEIYNNKISYLSTTTSSRYAFYGDAIWIGNQEQAPGPYTDLIYNNTIAAAPQGGIRDTHQNAKIYGNDISFNSLYTNDFCIDAPADGQQVYSNNCHPTSGRGIHTNANNVWIHDNVITVQELKQNAEYGGCELGGAYGIQLEFDNGFTSAAPTGVQIANNQITANAADCNAVGLRLTSMTATGSVVYSNNVVTTSNSGGSGLDYGVSFSADIEGPSRFLFTTNTFQSKYAYVTVDWDGANVIIPAGQTWKGTPSFVIDNENGFLDQAEGGPTCSQAVTLNDSISGAVRCGPYASGVQTVGSTSTKCN